MVLELVAIFTMKKLTKIFTKKKALIQLNSGTEIVELHIYHIVGRPFARIFPGLSRIFIKLLFKNPSNLIKTLNVSNFSCFFFLKMSRIFAKKR